MNENHFEVDDNLFASEILCDKCKHKLDDECAENPCEELRIMEEWLS